LPNGRGILDRERRAAGEETPDRPVEVGTAGGGTSLYDREPVGREDERRDLAAQLLGRAQLRPVQLRPLSVLELERHLDRSRTAAEVALERDPRPGGAQPDELLVGARSGGEALRPHVQRLEQVRLAGPVRTGHEHESGLEHELEPLVAAEVAERDVADDQARLSYPASLIGMIR
jgi:hypothetical protein